MGLGPIGRRVLGAFLVVALCAIATLVLAAAVGVDLSRSTQGRAEHQRMVEDLATSAARVYAEARSWDAADLAELERSAETAGGRLVVVDTDEETVVGGPVGPDFRTRAVTAPVVVAGMPVGTALLGFPESTAGLDRGITVRWLLLATLVAVAVATVVAVGFTRRFTRPLVDLTTSAREFGSGDRRARAATGGAGELGELARTFNDMADEVVRAEEARRRMSADVAHELRTPLTALQAGLEELRFGLAPAEPDTVAALHDQAVRLGRIVNDLSDLSSAESPSLTLHRVQMDLSDLVSDVLVVWRSRVAEAGATLRTSLRMGVWVDADSDRIHEVVTNLLSNAVGHSGPHGTIDVAVRAQDGRALLEVRDNGAGIAAEDLAYVLDRFYRGGGARARAGSGIGLAVVKALVTAHGGQIGIESVVDVGTTVTVSLPLAGRAP